MANTSTPPSRSSRKNKILLGTLIPLGTLLIGGTGLGVGYAIWHKKHTPVSNAKSLSITGLTELLIPFKTTYEYKCNVADATITAEGLPSGFSFNGHTLNTPNSIFAPGTFILNATTNNGLTCSRTISYFSGDCKEDNKCILIESGVQNPNVEVVGVDVSDGALSAVLTNDQKKLVTGVYFTNITSAYTSIDDTFLSTCFALTSIDLFPLSNVNSIGDDFLSHCWALSSIDLSPLSNVENIGAYFLGGNRSLTSIDLSSLSKVKTIGAAFLTSCYALSSIDLPPLSNVENIGDGFLTNCMALTSIDLSPLSKVQSVGNFFLSTCASLTSIDLSPLSNITSAGSYFLGSCYSLTSINLSPLSNLTKIEDGFLNSCSALKSIDLSPLSKVETISGNFLSNCRALISIDLSPLSSATAVGDEFLDSCYALTQVNVGNVDFTSKISDTDPMEDVTNILSNKIIGAQAPAFKIEIGDNISQWTVVP